MSSTNEEELKKKTFDLYRCHASVWADKSWRVALQIRIGAAYEAKDYYRKKACSCEELFSPEYEDYMHKYNDSSAAVGFNQKLLKESYEIQS